MKIYALFLNFVVVSFFIAGCSTSQKDEVVLATIGDSDITLTDFNERISNLPPKYQEFVNKRKEDFLEEIINDTLLYLEAVKNGLYDDADVRKVIEEAKKKILIARLLKDNVDDQIKINSEDIQIFYEANQKLYMAPEIMRVSHILVHSTENAESLLVELNEGTPFEDIARAKSVDPTAQRGGDIGYFPKGQLMPEFEQACEKLEVGEVSGIVKTALGYHIIMLTDRKPPKKKPIEQVKNDIEARLFNIKRQELFTSLLQRLRKETPISVNKDVLVENKTEEMNETGS